MKRVVSISLGSKTRDHRATITLLGQEIQVERIGTDGDVEQAKRLYEALDGEVDCFGVGGAILGIEVQKRRYDFSSVWKMVEGVRHTTIVDGEGIKNTVERRIMQYVDEKIGSEIPEKKAMIVSAVDRFGMALSFDQAGYDTVFADLMFVFGVPIPVRSIAGLVRLLRIIGPIATKLPMSALYPTGTKEDVIVPKFTKYYHRAWVVGGDCNYIRRHVPDDMQGRIIVTNTTTASDVEAFRSRGIKYLVTSTPRLGTRTFGTNVLEAALVALAGKGRPLTTEETAEYVEMLDLRPQIERLN